MKKIVFVGALICASLLVFAGCKQEENSTLIGNVAEVYRNFYNYPNGRMNANGMLTLKNNVSSSVLVFTDSVSGENYIGTIPALSSIKVKLNAGKFYNIVAVQKSVYEENPILATQTSKLAYYSDIQAYTVGVSADNLTGSATWIFNNNTNYWASVENVNESGETYAVIAPNAKRVSIPVQTNTSYPYKIVYKKELKYNSTTIAVADKTSMAENDEASFYNLTRFETDLNGTATKEYDDLAPTIQFINNSGKTVRVYKGQIQLSDAGIAADDYTLAAGVTAYFTAYYEGEKSVTLSGTNSTTLNVSSVAWTGKQNCTESFIFEKGKVYIVIISSNTGEDKANKPVLWTVMEKDAENFFEMK